MTKTEIAKKVVAEEIARWNDRNQARVISGFIMPTRFNGK